MSEKELGNKILKGLNSEQKKAVTHGQGPLLIIAGAGTGKTTVITRRVAWLILSNLVKTDQVLALTFTDKAAQEMEERIDKLLPYGYVDLWISTFHSFCERILQQHALDIGLPLNFKLLNQAQQSFLVQDNFDKFDLDYYRPLGNPTKFIQSLVKHFSRAKDELISPEEYLDYVENLKLDKDTSMSDELLDQETSRLKEIANAYHTYQQLLLENNALDFGDLINYTLKLFEKRPQILKKYQEQFKYILVDEFQDTNWAQYKLLQMLAQPKNNMTAVSDDDQCLPGNTLVQTKRGTQRIDQIKKGALVATAVGKGYLSYSKVNKVFKRKKKAKMLTFKTKKGYRVQVTDNHKMFCFTPRVSREKKYYYVYLMRRDDVGWRIGTTNNLAVRLKLERSADKILAIKACQSEEEARFYETLYSLKYGIQTTCFKERDRVMIKGDWMIKLYKKINVEDGARRLARDLKIDLSAHHYSLDAVNRGSKLRIKINFDMCKRRYRSKYDKDGFLTNPLIRHQASVETSDKRTINKLRKAGFNLTKARKGYRFKAESKDIKKIGKIAEKLQKVTGGILENGFTVGKTNIVFQKALIMPASNVLQGLYLPVATKRNGVIYDQVIEVKEEIKNLTVYDLEIERSHNFVANGIVVHNSIYKFRGASYNNVLQFKKDYPKTEQVVLIKNYRSQQKILDLAYNFIQLNNPERLEAQDKDIIKKLKAEKKDKGEIRHLHLKTQEDEARAVIKKIIELKQKDEEASWNDFAILVRANHQAELFVQALRLANVSHQFLARSGLFSKPVILDILAYLKLLDNYHESTAIYRVLTSPIFNKKISSNEVSHLINFANKKSWSVYEAMQKATSIFQLSKQTITQLNLFLSWIDKHTELAKTENVSKVVYAFLQDTGYLKILSNQEDSESVFWLNQFFKKIENFEAINFDKSVGAFIRLIDLMISTGDTGSIDAELEQGPESVKVSTIHSAKGLEFKYVFIVNLVDKRFPSIDRKEPIELPVDLIKEIIPQGDVHLQEERRLFYVALTRAKHSLYLTSAEDYGGKTLKKSSRFLYELGLVKKDKPIKVEEKTDVLTKPLVKQEEKQKTDIALPLRFSFSQFMAFNTCPLQYKFGFILRIPRQGRYVFSFGRSLHNTLYRFCQMWRGQKDVVQRDLFGEKKPQSKNQLSFDDLIKIYEQSWIEDWYDSKDHQEKYKGKGKQALKMFYHDFVQNKPNMKYLEKQFNFKLDKYIIRGVIDRVDETDQGYEIIDYKTGQNKASLGFEKKQQLYLYQLAAQHLHEAFDKPVHQLTFYYLESGERISFLGKDDDLKKVEENAIKTIEKIKKGDFPAQPSRMCKFCDFYNICQYRQE